MKIVIITQADSFVIPRNIEKVISLPETEVPLVVALNAQGTLSNKKMYFLKGFGFTQAFKMGIRLLAIKTLDVLDGLLAWKMFGNKSIRAVAGKYGIPFIEIGNPNDADFVKTLRSIGPDLIVSFSAPCVFGRELLSIPRLGCINLHCSLLPRYAGLLPSFWILYHHESQTGATVHFMDDRIDNGGILAQRTVLVKNGMTMFELIQLTKSVGGDLICQVISSFPKGRYDIKNNIARPDGYFSWPSIKQMQEFRRSGGRLI